MTRPRRAGELAHKRTIYMTDPEWDEALRAAATRGISVGALLAELLEFAANTPLIPSRAGSPK